MANSKTSKRGFRKSPDPETLLKFISAGEDGGPSVLDAQQKPASESATVRDVQEPPSTPARSGGKNRNPTPAVRPKVPEFPWEDPAVRDDLLKVFNLRLPEPLYLKLKFLSDYSPRSMQQICLDALRPAIERELKKLLNE
ncbi:MAG: hypothetical protein D6761_05225 [Candidatus Dadabacteria bacterium]|nr:MAG: hypothetical protein D6761_05225 [Candidatus Dadabacteria bacterium]